MTKRSSADVGFLLVDGYDIMGQVTELTDNTEAVIEESIPYSSEWPDNLYTGIKKADISQDGYFDDATDSINDALKDKSGDIRLLCYGLEGNEIGQQFIGYEGAMQVNYERIATRGQLHRANAKYLGSGQVDSGDILHGHGIEDDDGDSKLTPVSVGAQTTAGGVAYLQGNLLTLDGATNVIVKVLHSTDEISWDVLTTFTAITAVPVAERKILTGTVKKHLAVSWEFTGGAGANSEIKFMVGFVRN